MTIERSQRVVATEGDNFLEMIADDRGLYILLNGATFRFESLDALLAIHDVATEAVQLKRKLV